MQIYGSLEVFCYISQSECFSPCGVARIFLPPYAAAGIRTHVSRVAPTWDLLKGALLTEFRVTYFWPVLSLGLVDQLPSRWVHLLCQAVKLVSSQPYGVQKKNQMIFFGPSSANVGSWKETQVFELPPLGSNFFWQKSIPKRFRTLASLLKGKLQPYRYDRLRLSWQTVGRSKWWSRVR